MTARLMAEASSDLATDVKRRCTHCNRNRDISKFEVNPNTGEPYNSCGRCLAKDRRRSKRKRQHDEAWVVRENARTNDGKRGIKNNLTVLFVRWFIRNGCFYCGDITNKMSLDRMDLTRPHDQDNVKPCCIRCNHIRNDMPYYVFLVFFAPLIRMLRIAGILGDWRHAPRRGTEPVAQRQSS